MGLPSTFCYPTHPHIWLTLISDPLEPEDTIPLKALSNPSDFIEISATPAIVLFNVLLKIWSNDSRIFLPGWSASNPPSIYAFWKSSSTFCLDFLRTCEISEMALSGRRVSETLKVNPCPSSHWSTICYDWVRKFFATSGPYSSQIQWRRPPLEVPIMDLSNMPEIISPCLRINIESLTVGSASPSLYSLFLICKLISGTSIERICLPVQSTLGLKTAGYGNLPSNSSTYIMRFMTSALFKKVSLLVKSLMPSKVSITNPRQGLLDWGEMIWFLTFMSYLVSAMVW